jgi:hypothetical protein
MAAIRSYPECGFGIEAIRYIRARFGNRPIPSRLITGDTAVCGQSLSAT